MARLYRVYQRKIFAMRKKFTVSQNKDAANAFVSALLAGGYEYTNQLSEADFLIFDHENIDRRRAIKEQFLENHAGFIYPHTPLTYWLWDGIYNPLPVACNFVSAPGAKLAMESYGYPYPIEVIGFSRCEVLPFQRTDGRRLLFVPARPRRDKGRQEILDNQALSFVREYASYFESVMICRLEGQFPLLHDGDFGMTVITTNPKQSKNPAAEMIERIDAADLIISTTTPAALAVARGKPTVFYGETTIPETITGKYPSNYHLYKHIHRFPITLENMSIVEVLGQCKYANPSVEHWKEKNIGENFNQEMFLNVIKKHVEA